MSRGVARSPHALTGAGRPCRQWSGRDRKSTRLNSSHDQISYAVFCLKKKKTTTFTIGSAEHTIELSTSTMTYISAPNNKTPHDSEPPKHSDHAFNIIIHKITEYLVYY